MPGCEIYLCNIFFASFTRTHNSRVMIEMHTGTRCADGGHFVIKIDVLHPPFRSVGMYMYKCIGWCPKKYNYQDWIPVCEPNPTGFIKPKESNRYINVLKTHTHIHVLLYTFYLRQWHSQTRLCGLSFMMILQYSKVSFLVFFFCKWHFTYSSTIRRSYIDCLTSANRMKIWPLIVFYLFVVCVMFIVDVSYYNTL